MSRKNIPVSLLRSAWAEIVGVLKESDGMGSVNYASLAIAVEIESQLDKYCIGGYAHEMIRPDDTDRIKWGEYGICTLCHTVRRME